MTNNRKELLHLLNSVGICCIIRTYVSVRIFICLGSYIPRESKIAYHIKRRSFYKQTEPYFSQSCQKNKKQDSEGYQTIHDKKETLPLLTQYLEDRNTWLEHIWIHTWRDYASKSISKDEKLLFLKGRGYIVEGVNRKIINRLFSDEVASFKSFDVKSWLLDEFSGGEK